MATTRIMPLHVGKGRTESRAISDIIDYVANPKKTDNGRLITGYACDSRTADAEFLLAKRQYIAATGRVRGADDVIAYHVRQSFRPGEITPEEANRLGVEFAKRFTKGNHAFVVCTHIDKYLSEHNLLEYAVLEEKAAAATAHHNELSAQIKAAEKRMAEIAVLRTHIVNYAKTREGYVAYRKAGYSKKFREEHEEEILLHQAAKNAFDEMGVKKLPKVKELQTEYAKLLEEKKKTYVEYRRSREEMRELLTAKANVDRVLKMEIEQDVEKEKDHGQR